MATIAGLSAGAVAGFRTQLEQDRNRLVRRLVPSGERYEPTANSGHGETEHIQIEGDRAVEELVQGSARDALADIELALARIEAGSYGACSACNAPIPVARLEAMPTTHRCLQCQERLERSGGPGRR